MMGRFMQYYRENAKYLERTYDFVERIGIDRAIGPRRRRRGHRRARRRDAEDGRRLRRSVARSAPAGSPVAVQPNAAASRSGEPRSKVGGGGPVDEAVVGTHAAHQVTWIDRSHPDRRRATFDVDGLEIAVFRPQRRGVRDRRWFPHPRSLPTAYRNGRSICPFHGIVRLGDGAPKAAAPLISAAG